MYYKLKPRFPGFLGSRDNLQFLTFIVIIFITKIYSLHVKKDACQNVLCRRVTDLKTSFIYLFFYAVVSCIARQLCLYGTEFGFSMHGNL